MMGIFTNAITRDFSLGHQMVHILGSSIPLQYGISTNRVFITRLNAHICHLFKSVCALRYVQQYLS